ncbi:MAG: ABC transporter substrate-binding protein [Acidimicrobiia bacterium]|nr:ABC transporter substrate-binding protein [Acidimicrobiia bacterium]
MIRRLLLIVAVVAVVGTALAACGDSSKTITIGALYPRTGSQGSGGTNEFRGVELAADWANDASVAKGTKIKLASVDAARAEQVPDAMDALARRGASIVIGSHGSAISAAAAREATVKKLAFFETGAVGQTAPEDSNGTNFFRMAPMGANLGRSAIDFVQDQLASKLPTRGPLRYGVAYVDDPYGRAVAQGALDTIKERGLDLVGSFAYDANAKDFSPVAARIAAAHPDVLFSAAYVDDGVAVRKALVAAHTPLLAAIGTSSSYCMQAFGNALGPDAVGLFASDKPDAADVNASALTPEGRRMLDWASKRYQSIWHQPMDAAALSGFSNAYALFVHVLPQAGKLSVPDVAKAALAVKLPQGSLANGGGLDLAPPGAVDAGGNRRAAGVIEEWIAPGKKATVWPPAFAEHPVEALPLA